MAPRTPKRGSRALLGLASVCALAAPADAQSRQVFGYAGLLGEWELTATVAHSGQTAGDELFGPLTVTHVGICTQDGPEQKFGHIRLKLYPELTAVLSIADMTCTFTAKSSDVYKGLMGCTGREPVPLSIWVK